MANSELEMDTLLRDYRLSLQTEGKSPATIKWYLPFLARFRDYLEREALPTSVDRIDRVHVRAFIGYLQSEAKVPRTGAPLSPATVEGYVRALKDFFSWLEREEYLATNPLRQLPTPRIPVKVINTFTPEDIAALMEVVWPEKDIMYGRIWANTVLAYGWLVRTDVPGDYCITVTAVGQAACLGTVYGSEEHQINIWDWHVGP